MSAIRLVFRDAEREISGTIHGSDADRAVAAGLSPQFARTALGLLWWIGSERARVVVGL